MSTNEVEITPVHGSTDHRFAWLIDPFARLVGTQGGGAAIAVYQSGRLVADLYAGDYQADSLQLVFSVSKSITSIAAARAHADGLLDLDRPMATYWPELDKPSTAGVTLRMVLAHRSGLASLAADLSFEELLAGADDEAIGRQEPYWEPDERHGYHAFTFGTLTNGAFRRVLGVSVGDFVRERLAEPLGLDLWIGAPAAIEPRVERIRYRPPLNTAARAEHVSSSGIPGSNSGRLQATFDLYNDPRLYRTCWPSTSGVAGARDLARLFASTLDTVDGVRVVDEPTRRAMVAPLSDGVDAVLGIRTAFGSGVQLPFPHFPMVSADSYGHEAAGGSAVMASAALDLAIGFTTNVFPNTMGVSPTMLALLPTVLNCARDESLDVPRKEPADASAAASFPTKYLTDPAPTRVSRWYI